MKNQALSQATQSLLDGPFVDQLQERVSHSITELERRLRVVLQGPENTGIAAQIARCDEVLNQLLSVIPQAIAVPLHFVSGAPRGVVFHTFEGGRVVLGEAELPAIEDVSCIVLGNGTEDNGIELVAGEHVIETWAQLGAADISFLTCTRELSYTQKLFIRTSAEWGMQMNLVLLQIDGDELTARRNGETVAKMGATARLFVGDRRCPPELERLLAKSAERARLDTGRTVAAELYREGSRRVRLQELELTALHDPLNPAFRAMAEEEVKLQRQANAEVSRIRDARWPQIDREASTDQDQLLQSAGPVMQVIDRELKGVAPVDLGGWASHADRVDQALVVLNGLFFANFARKHSSRIESLLNEMLKPIGVVHAPHVSPTVSTGTAGRRAIPKIHGLPVYSTLLNGFIKWWISLRATSTVTTHLRGRTKLLGAGVAGCEQVLGAVTAAQQLKKNVQDDYDSQASLKVLPVIGSVISPQLRAILSDMSNFVHVELVQYIETYVTETEALVDRCQRILDTPDPEDPDGLVQSGLAELTRSIDCGSAALGQLSEVMKVAESRLEVLDKELPEFGRRFMDLALIHVLCDQSPLPNGPSPIQTQEIREFVATVLWGELGFAPQAATRLASGLMGESADPLGDKVPLKPADLQRVKAVVRGIDVFYKQTSNRSIVDWDREIRVFLKGANGKYVEKKESKPVQWTDLPDEVRQARAEQDLAEQRFVFYSPNKRN